MNNITLESKIRLIDIDINIDKKNYIVEDKLNQEFYEMPKICIDALELIQDGLSLNAVEKSLLKLYPIEDVDIIDFANQLLDLNLIESINDQRVIRNTNKIEKAKLGYEWVSPTLGKIFFNPYTKYFYAITFVANIIIFILYPTHFPHYKDLFIFDTMSLNIVVFCLLTFLMVIIHETGHILAIRSYNLPTKLEIGRRLFIVVFETDLSLAWKLSPEKRNTLFLAGVCFDSTFLFIALIIKLFVPVQSAIFMGIVGLIIFDTVLRIIFQFCIYMKTDFYYLFENLSGTYNIMDNGIHLIKNIFKKEKVTNPELFVGEEKIVKFYSLFYLIGIIITIGVALIYYLPQLIYMGITMLPGYTKPPTDPSFWDAIVFTIQFLLLFALISYSFLKTNRKKMVGN